LLLGRASKVTAKKTQSFCAPYALLELTVRVELPVAESARDNRPEAVEVSDHPPFASICCMSTAPLPIDWFPSVLYQPAIVKAWRSRNQVRSATTALPPPAAPIDGVARLSNARSPARPETPVASAECRSVARRRCSAGSRASRGSRCSATVEPKCRRTLPSNR
jgi:hypothetical protein